MKILTPVNELPARSEPKPYDANRSKTREKAYLAAKRVPGLWLPVECGDWNEAAALANGARRHSTWIFDVEQRRNIAYLRFIGRRGFQPIRKPSAEIEAERTLERIGA